MLYRFKDMDVKPDENIKEWCNENLTDGEVEFGATTIYIQSEIDAMAFELRWI